MRFLRFRILITRFEFLCISDYSDHVGFRHLFWLSLIVNKSSIDTNLRKTQCALTFLLRLKINVWIKLRRGPKLSWKYPFMRSCVTLERPVSFVSLIEILIFYSTKISICAEILISFRFNVLLIPFKMFFHNYIASLFKLIFRRIQILYSKCSRILFYFHWCLIPCYNFF